MSVFKPITKRLYRVAAGSVRAANVRHYRGHGVHSPFVYSLVRQVFMRRRVEGANTALYADLVSRHVSRRRATQLQNLYTHCGYENFLFADAQTATLDGVEMCIVPREYSIEQLHQLTDEARRTQTTLCILAPRDERARSRQCRRLVSEHHGTSVDNRGYLLLFYVEGLPKQHFSL